MSHDPHVNYYSDWQTSPEWVDWVHETMGGIDTDPCGPPTGNPTRARRVIRPDEDGLVKRWRGKTYVNPPGSNSAQSVKAWWAHGQEQRLAALTWCFFNFEAIRHLDPCPADLHGYFVMPLDRIAFFKDGKRFKRPRNWTWFFTTRPPAATPTPCRIIPTGRRIVGVLAFPGTK